MIGNLTLIIIGVIGAILGLAVLFLSKIGGWRKGKEKKWEIEEATHVQ